MAGAGRGDGCCLAPEGPGSCHPPCRWRRDVSKAPSELTEPFTGGKEGVLWYYRSLVTELTRGGPGHAGTQRGRVRALVAAVGIVAAGDGGNLAIYHRRRQQAGGDNKSGKVRGSAVLRVISFLRSR